MCFAPLIPALGAAAGAGGAAAGGSTILGTIGTIATIGGGLLSAYGQIQNNKAIEQAAKVDAINQQIAANQAIEQGQDESEQRRRAGAQTEGANIAALAANGVDVTGSQAIDILDDNKFLVEEDAFAIRENARRTAQGFSQQSANSTARAKSARSSGFFQPVGTILTTAAKVGNKYSAWVTQSRTQPAGAF